MSESVPDDVFVDDIEIRAPDGTRLAATLFLPRKAKRTQAILINSAAAVPRQYYRGFAGYLSGRGCAVLIYDYRGIGGSRPKSLKGYSAKMSDWALLDARAAVDWMRSRYKELPLSVVGHSFGGQAVGLLANNNEIQRTLFVGAQAGYWKMFAPAERYRVYAMMRFLGTPLAHLLGYVPGRVGVGQDMPRDVFLQWVSWVMQPRYFFTDNNLEGLSNFEKYRGELRAVCVTDDPWATLSAVKMLTSGFTSIEPTIVEVAPCDHGGKPIGHFGFFRSQHRTTLWRESGDWLTGEVEVEEAKPAATPAPPAALPVVQLEPARQTSTLTADVEHLLARFHTGKGLGPDSDYSAASRT